MAKHLIRLKPNTEIENNSRKKKGTALWVIVSHITFLFILFFVFTFKGCINKTKPNTIQVTLVSPQQSVQQNSGAISKNTPEKQPDKQSIKPEKQWKALDPGQIRKSTTIIKKQKPAPPVKKYTSVDAKQIAKSLESSVKSIKFNNSFNVNASILNYYDEVSSYLYERWQQPGRSVLGNRIPVVSVKITVDASGNVKDYSITKLSGISAMDSSVKDLLQSLSNLPKPPDGAMTIDVSLELEN